MARFVERATDNLLDATNGADLEKRFENQCDYCCLHACRRCKGCPVKEVHDGLADFFGIRDSITRVNGAVVIAR